MHFFSDFESVDQSPLSLPDLHARHPEQESFCTEFYRVVVHLELLSRRERGPNHEEMEAFGAELLLLYNHQAEDPPAPLVNEEFAMVRNLPTKLLANQTFNRQYIYPACTLLLGNVARRSGIGETEFARILAFVGTQEVDSLAQEYEYVCTLPV